MKASKERVPHRENWIRKTINGIKHDFLGIDLGGLIALWVLSLLVLSLLLSIIAPILIALTLIPKVGAGVAIFCMYLLICFWGSYLTIEKVKERFRWLPDLAERWDYLSMDEINKFKNVVTGIVDKNEKEYPNFYA